MLSFNSATEWTSYFILLIINSISISFQSRRSSVSFVVLYKSTYKSDNGKSQQFACNSIYRLVNCSLFHSVLPCVLCVVFSFPLKIKKTALRFIFFADHLLLQPWLDCRNLSGFISRFLFECLARYFCGDGNVFLIVQQKKILQLCSFSCVCLKINSMPTFVTKKQIAKKLVILAEKKWHLSQFSLILTRRCAHNMTSNSNSINKNLNLSQKNVLSSVKFQQKLIFRTKARSLIFVHKYFSWRFFVVKELTFELTDTTNDERARASRRVNEPPSSGEINFLTAFPNPLFLSLIVDTFFSSYYRKKNNMIIPKLNVIEPYETSAQPQLF